MSKKESRNYTTLHEPLMHISDRCRCW